MLSEGIKKGIEVYIARDDGTQFTEHRVEHSKGSRIEPSTTSCFLESEEGSVFTIVIDIERTFGIGPNPAWRSTIHVDGRMIARSVRKLPQIGLERVRMMVSQENGKLVEGRLTFAKLRTTGDELAVTVQAGQLHPIGQISVTLERGNYVEGDGPHIIAVVQSDVGVASERGKKFGGVVESTSQIPYNRNTPVVLFLPIDANRPFHRMTFNYRTKPVLELMGIVEAPAPQIPVVQPVTSKKRKSSGFEIKEEIPACQDIKPSRKALLAARLRDLERQLEMAIAAPKAQGPAEIIDLTGKDPDEE